MTVDEVVWLVDRIKPILAGCPTEIQGGALADCLAIWLAGHCVPDDAAGTKAFRDELLSLHIDAVRQLVVVNAAMMRTTTGEK